MSAIRQATGPAQPDSDRILNDSTPAHSRAAYRLSGWESLRTAERACCCTARPQVAALMPPAPGRTRQADLLFCLHHFRRARYALARAGAIVVDRDGRLVRPGMSGYLPAR